MKRFLLIFLFALIVSPIFSQDNEESIPEKSTYYFIRHAEKNKSDASNKDPQLIEKGLLRAAKWSFLLENVSFDAVYSTNYARTVQTAQPTAEKNGLEITLYDPRNIDAQGFLEKTKGMNVLVVGHSNSTPSFVNAIIGKDKYQQIDENNNANLYIVTITGSEVVSDLLLVVN